MSANTGWSSCKNLVPGLLLVGLVGLVGPDATASPIFVAGRFDQGTFVAGKEVASSVFTIRYATITHEVAEGQVRSRLTETVAGPAQGTLETALIVPLPGELGPQQVQLGVDGRELKALEGRFLSVGEANPIYEQLASAMKRTDLLAFTGRPALLVPKLLLGVKAEVTLALVQPLRTEQGFLQFKAPMPAASFGREPIRKLTLTATVQHGLPLRAIFSPSHEVTIERKGITQVVLRHSAEQVTSGDDFVLYLTADRDPLGLRLLTHRAPGEETGYFLLIGNPSGAGPEEQPQPKDLILALDVSGSMRGEKLEQAQSALEYCLERLNPGDRFNIITFGTAVQTFQPEPVAASGANVQAARVWVDELEALGRTNISEALQRSLAGAPAVDRPRLLLFLTDGAPTAGEQDPVKILKRLPEWNRSATRIFVVGMGHDVNTHLLDRLAEATEGSSEYLDEGEEIDTKVAALFDRLSHPVLDRVALSYGGLQVQQVYPERIPSLFQGSDLLVIGRYQGGGPHTLTLSGTQAGAPRKYEVRADFPGQPAPANAFVAPLWASRRIGYLLAQIRLHGEQPELVQEVVRLSQSFGIITEYTEFISQADTQDLTPEAAAEEAGRRIRTANVLSSGFWAVKQAGNERQLQQKVVVSADSNRFVDRKGQTRVATKVKQVGRRVFYQKGDQWVESAPVTAATAATGAAPAAAPKPARSVKLFSDEYFQLLRSNKDFAEAQKLGGKMTLEVNGESVQLH